MSLKDIEVFLVSTVLVRYVVGPMVGDYIRKKLIKTERDAIVWVHYKLRTQRKGHNQKHPQHCQQGRCREITG